MSKIPATTHESARWLGIGRTKLFDILKRNDLRAVRLGGRTLIPVAELERFAASLPPRNVYRRTGNFDAPQKRTGHDRQGGGRADQSAVQVPQVGELEQ